MEEKNGLRRHVSSRYVTPVWFSSSVDNCGDVLIVEYVIDGEVIVLKSARQSLLHRRT